MRLNNPARVPMSSINLEPLIEKERLTPLVWLGPSADLEEFMAVTKREMKSIKPFDLTTSIAELVPIGNFDSVFERQKEVFNRIRETLANEPQYQGKYVAIVDGKLADSDVDKIRLAERLYLRYGYIPFYVGEISKQKRYVHIRSPRRS
jgi:hypothetical protein